MTVHRTASLVAAVAAATFAALFVSAPARAVVIDSFDTATPTIAIAGNGTSSATTTAGAGIVGGERDVFFTILSGGGGMGGSDLTVGGGSLAFNNGLGVTSSLSMIWDGVDGDATTNAFGLGGADLTEGGDLIGLTFTAIADHDVNVTLRLFEDASNYSEATVGFIGDGQVSSVTTLFSELVDTGAGADATSVEAVELAFNLDGGVDSLDFRLEGFSATATAPAAALLFALVGALFWRRRRMG